MRDPIVLYCMPTAMHKRQGKVTNLCIVWQAAKGTSIKNMTMTMTMTIAMIIKTSGQRL